MNVLGFDFDFEFIGNCQITALLDRFGRRNWLGQLCRSWADAL